MTMGELARFFNAELGVGADLPRSSRASGWRRDMWFDQTGLPWINPSPNIRSLGAAALYPGTVLVEGTNLSEGRGTDAPFETLRAPSLPGDASADRLNSLSLAGVRFEATSFTPTTSKFAGVACEGVSIRLTDRSAIDPCAIGVAVVASARAQAPRDFAFIIEHFDRLSGTDALRGAITNGATPQDIVQSWQPELSNLRPDRAPYLLY